MKSIIVIIALALLSGCASIDMKGQLENRLACAQAKDRLFVVSMYGDWFGLATVIADRDRSADCR